MNFVEQLSAVVLLVDFLLGVVFGVVGGASHGSRREDREYSLLTTAPDDVSAGARLINGVCTRDDGYLRGLLPGGGEKAGDASGDDSAGSHGQELDR